MVKQISQIYAESFHYSSYLSPDGIRATDNCSLCYCFVLYQGTFNLKWTYTVPENVKCKRNVRCNTVSKQQTNSVPSYGSGIRINLIFVYNTYSLDNPPSFYSLTKVILRQSIGYIKRKFSVYSLGNMWTLPSEVSLTWEEFIPTLEMRLVWYNVIWTVYQPSWEYDVIRSTNKIKVAIFVLESSITCCKCLK